MFRKSRADAPAGFFACEAAGLQWLREAAGAPVVHVIDVGQDHLDLERLVAVPPTREAAAAFGRALARTHAAEVAPLIERHLAGEGIAGT